MGRPKKSAETARVKNLIVKMSKPFHDHVSRVAATAGDADVSAMVERLIVRESRRLKLPNPPPR